LGKTMPIVIGADLGTTTITAIAFDAGAGQLLTAETRSTPPANTSASDRGKGRAEWDVRAIAQAACDCLRALADRLGERRRDLVGLGLTGQQHGVVLVDEHLQPLTPFINWQDRRGDELISGSSTSYVTRARQLLGEEAPGRTGYKLATGYLAVTLFWLKSQGLLPAKAKACFITDYLAALLTGQASVTDPTMAASSGVLNLQTGAWDDQSIDALELPEECFSELRQSGSVAGPLTAAMAQSTGLPEGLPVCVGIGDNQASFAGSVPRPENAVLVNVGTGGQVSAWTNRFLYHPQLETRPFPRGGFLLVSAGLCGGRSYALLEQFFRMVGDQLFHLGPAASIYEAMNRAADAVPRGAEGLRCEPFFTGARAHPELRGVISGIAPENFTPGHLARALLEGMASAFRTSYDLIAREAKLKRSELICAGNGMRENPLLVKLVAEAFGLPATLSPHREEAAYGAARIAAIGLGLGGADRQGNR
jgi:sugar (pentulose or hexulose) kinase